MLSRGTKARRIRRWAASLAVTGMLFSLAAPYAGARPDGPSRIALKEEQAHLLLMIELEGQPMAAVSPGKASIEQASILKGEHARLRQDLNKAGVAYRLLSEHTKLFNGVAVEVKVTDMARIAGLPGVKGVHAVRRHAMPEPQLSSSVPMVGAPEAWAGNPGAGVPGVDGSGIRVAIIDTGLSVGHRT